MPDKPVPPPPAEAVGLTPFYPAKGPQSGAASPHVLGPLGTFQKFPEHIPDDHEEKMKLVREAAAAAKIDGAAWRPTYANKTCPTMWKTRRLRPRPAGSPEAPFRDRSCLRLP